MVKENRTVDKSICYPRKENMRKTELGTWAEIPTPYVTHIMAKAGFDFSIIDMEHGVIDFELAQNMIYAAHSENRQIYVRVPVIEEAWILRTLDMGCDGIIFPQVSSVRDIEKIIEYAYFAPVGNRGFNPYIAAGGYSSVRSDYFENENRRIKVGVILEGKEAFEDLDKILRYDEIDIIYIGQYDLSMALGVPGDVTNTKVTELMDKAVTKINIAGKKAGCMVHSIEEAKKIIKQGFSFIVYKVDSGLLFQSVQNFVKGVQESEVI